MTPMDINDKFLRSVFWPSIRIVKPQIRQILGLGYSVHIPGNYHDWSVSTAFIKAEAIGLVVSIVVHTSKQGGLIAYIQITKHWGYTGIYTLE